MRTNIKLDLNAEQLKRYMESKGISEPRMANHLDIDYSYFYRLLRDQRNVGLKFYFNLRKYCKKEGINLEEFITEREGD